METIKKLLEDITTLAARRSDSELLLIIRRRLSKLSKEDPDLASWLSHTISNVGGVGALRRFNSLGEMPKDADSGLELTTLVKKENNIQPPILPSEIQSSVDRFVHERESSDKLRNAGISVPSSLALIGKPGTGKTTLARWIASRLYLPMLSLNIASVVTSYLGQTGLNLKKVFERAKIEPCLLFLDEFDALGYHRSNGFDVGEMRRVVTVLLQEVEVWPEESIVIAATNLPQQLDFAFKRRFSRWIELPLPDFNARVKILKLYYGQRNFSENLLELLAAGLPGDSGADLKNIIHRIKACEILEGVSSRQAVWEELEREFLDRDFSKEEMSQFAYKARKADPKFFTLRKIASILRISHTTVSSLVKTSK